MEEAFAEQIVPGTFIRVLSEGLIAPKGVSFGNVGIVGTAAAAAGAPADAIGSTQILSSLEDGQKLYKFKRTGGADTDTLNLARSLKLLFDNGARTVYSHALAAGASATGTGGNSSPARVGTPSSEPPRTVRFAKSHACSSRPGTRT